MSSNNKYKLFGFEIVGQNQGKANDLNSPVEIRDEYGLPVGGVFTTGHLVDYRYRSEAQLIQTYRDISMNSEVEYAIDEILNEILIFNGVNDPVSIELKDTGLDEDLEKKVRDEFYNILRLLSFQKNSYEIFKRWYVDGRIYFNVILNEKSPKKGIQEIRYIDPLQIKHIKEPIPTLDAQGNPVYSENKVNEYYEYYPMGMSGSNSKNKIMLSKDSIIHIPSGQFDRSRGLVVSYLDKAIKPLNNLRHLEDSNVIYTMARAPMRRIFTVNVDGIPAAKQEEYMRQTMARYRNKIDYDPKTGQILDQRKYQAMLEDIWLPSREGKTATVTNLDGAGNLMEMPQVEYFKRALYQSLNVPVSRLLESKENYNWGKDSEISREEIKFSKFINRLRHTFSDLFTKLLRIQLSIKGIISVDDWHILSQDVKYIFESELYYHEMQELEIIKKRMEAYEAVKEYSSKTLFFSDAYIDKHILGQNEQISLQMKQDVLREIFARAKMEKMKKDMEASAAKGESLPQIDLENGDENSLTSGFDAGSDSTDEFSSEPEIGASGAETSTGETTPPEEPTAETPPAKEEPPAESLIYLNNGRYKNKFLINEEALSYDEEVLKSSFEEDDLDSFIKDQDEKNEIIEEIQEFIEANKFNK